VTLRAFAGERRQACNTAPAAIDRYVAHNALSSKPAGLWDRQTDGPDRYIDPAPYTNAVSVNNGTRQTVQPLINENKIVKSYYGVRCTGLYGQTKLTVNGNATSRVNAKALKSRVFRK